MKLRRIEDWTIEEKIEYLNYFNSLMKDGEISTQWINKILEIEEKYQKKLEAYNLKHIIGG